MKRFITLFFVLKFFNLMIFSQSFTVKLADDLNKFTVSSSVDSINFRMNLTQLDFEIMFVNNDSHIIINAPDFLPTQNTANPQLIQSNYLFEIPNGKNPIVNIVNQKWSEIKLNNFSNSKIIPNQASIVKTNPDLTFQKNLVVYSTDGFYQLDLVSIETIGFMRSYNLAKLLISPLKYNPVSNVLLVCTEIDFYIEFVDDNQIVKQNAKVNNLSQNQYFSFVESLSLNSNELKTNKNINLFETVSFLIITDSIFQNSLMPFVNHKTQQGFLVETAFVNSSHVGNSSASIKSFISSKFDSSSVSIPAPTFVLLVGDHQFVPSATGATANHPSDWFYAQISPDVLPDLFIGRFSASDTSELNAIIQKSLAYEQFLFPSSNYLGSSLLVSGTDVNFSGLQGNAHLNYVAQNFLNSQNGNNANVILYPQSIGSTNLMTQHLSNGMGIVNYTGHGTPSGWSDPSLNIANINNVQNFGKSSIIISNACLTAKFDNQTCIGEALHRKANSGAVAYIGASNNTYWDEDFWWSVGYKPITHSPQYLPSNLGMWDRWFNINNQVSNNSYVTLGQMIVAGNLAVEMSNSNFRNYYWEVYHVFGDPSLMPYQKIPAQLTAAHPSNLLIGSNQMVVDTEPFAFVGFSQNNILIASAYANENGLAILNFDPLAITGIAKINVSKQNRIPYSNNLLISNSLDANVVNLNFDFVELNSNPNGIVDYSDLLSFSFSAKNFGLDSNSNVIAILTSLSPYLNVIVDTISLGSFSVGETKFFNEKFLVQVADFVPDKHDALIKLKIFTGLNVWESTIKLNLNSPVYQLSDYTFIDTIVGNSNLWFEPGETVNAVLDFFNNSDSYGKNINVHLSSSSNNLSFYQNNFLIDSILAKQQIQKEITMTLSQQATLGDEIYVYFEFNDGIYSFFDTLVFVAGVLIEDFETNSFTKFPWFNGYSSESFAWEISDSQVFQGNYSAASASISHNQFTELAIVIEVFEADTISFFYKTSCENPGQNTYWDYLSFGVNNLVQKKWAGESMWDEARFLLPQGIHTLSWKYVKDNSISSFQDKVWIDNIVFPKKSRLLNTTSIFDETTDNFSLVIYPNPAIDEIFIASENVADKFLTVKITDIYGRIFILENIENLTDDKIFKKLDISSLKKGVYLVTLYSSSKKITRKFIVL